MKKIIKLLIVFTIIMVGETAKSQVSQIQFTDSLIGQIIASDPDVGQTLTYEIVVGNENNIFYVDKNTGILYWHKKPILDNQLKTYVLTIKVTDNGIPPLSSFATCTVNLIPTLKTP